jgi:hypothetical protein
MAVSRLSKRPAPGALTLSVRRALSLTSASEALESSLTCRIIRSSTLCQKNWSPISTTEGGRSSPGLLPELSPTAEPLWSVERPLSTVAASSTPRSLWTGLRFTVVKPCSGSLVNSSSSIVGRSRWSSSFSLSFSLSLPPLIVPAPGQIPTRSVTVATSETHLYLGAYLEFRVCSPHRHQLLPLLAAAC